MILWSSNTHFIQLPLSIGNHQTRHSVLFAPFWIPYKSAIQGALSIDPPLYVNLIDVRTVARKLKLRLLSILLYCVNPRLPLDPFSSDRQVTTGVLSERDFI